MKNKVKDQTKNYYKYECDLVVMNILSIVLLVVPFIILIMCGYSINMDFGVLKFIILILYFFLHELFHALGYSFFVENKKNIKIGVVLEKGVFYAMCQERINKKGIIISLLMPLIFLSIIPFLISLYFHFDYLLILSIINFSGAIGDILMTKLIIRAPRDVEYLDYNNDIGAYLLSSEDMSNYKSFGFKLTEKGNADSKKIDKSIKRLYISKISYVFLVVFTIMCIILVIV